MAKPMKTNLLPGLLFGGCGLFTMVPPAYSGPSKCTSIFEDGTKSYENREDKFMNNNIYSITRIRANYRIGENGWIPDNKYCIKNLESGNKFCLIN